MKNNLRSEILREISNQKQPFCLIDIYAELEKITDDRNLILECVNALFAARLLDYRYINEEEQWAFVVVP